MVFCACRWRPIRLEALFPLDVMKKIGLLGVNRSQFKVTRIYSFGLG